MNKISIVVVTYNPEIIEFKKNLMSYLDQVPLVVIIDNSDNEKSIADIRKLGIKIDSLHVIQLFENKGIAAAQNIGIQHCIDLGFEYFIELDQDSELNEDYVQSAFNSFCKIKETHPKILGLGPLAFSKSNGNLYHHNDHETTPFIVEKTLSSGFLSTKSAFETVGKKDESLFIDLVDWEWCWRAKQRNYVTLIDPSLKIDHMLGDGHKEILGFQVGVPSPIRHYYQYRNSFYLMRLPYVPLQWKIKRFIINLLKIPIYILFFNRKLVRLKYVFLGFLHFLSGKKGKITE